MADSSSKAKYDKALTPDAIKREVERLVNAGQPRKLIVSIGRGAVQSAHVEYHEAVKP
jgi:hypothetical protein